MLAEFEGPGSYWRALDLRCQLVADAVLATRDEVGTDDWRSLLGVKP